MATEPSLGELVRRRRRALELTQAQVAARVACATVTIRKIEASERMPSPLMAQRLADALELTGAQRSLLLARAAGRSAPTSAPAAGPVTLPSPLTAIVGREREVASAAAALGGDPPAARLLTLTGPPGVGKTRLAIEVARRVAADARLGVVFVELAPVAEPGLVLGRIAQAAGVRAADGTDAERLLPGWLARRSVLLVLDNFEQVADAAVAVGDLLAACPATRCLVTSRRRLDIYGEHEQVVPPLAAGAAAELFTARATAAAGRAVGLDPGDEQVERICAATDGLPLAIELAAGRTRDLSLQAIADQLREGAARLLHGSARGRDERQQTIRGAVRWSRALLGEDARLALDAAAAFAGDFTAPDCAALMRRDTDAEPLLAELCDHALLRPTGDEGYRMLSVVRAVAREELATRGELEATLAHHAALLAAIAEATAPSLTDAQREAAVAALRARDADLHAALGFSLGDGGDPSVACRLVRALAGYWNIRARWSEALGWATRAERVASRPHDLARVRFALGCLRWLRGESAVAAELLDGAARLAVEAGDRLLTADAVTIAANLPLMRGDAERARAALDRAAGLYDAGDCPVGVAFCALLATRVAMMEGDLEAARDHGWDAVERYERAGSDWGVANAIGNLAECDLAAGDPQTALARHLWAAARLEAIGADWYAVGQIGAAACALTAIGAFDRAAALFAIVDEGLRELDAPVLPVLAAPQDAARARIHEQLGDDAGAGTVPADDERTRAALAAALAGCTPAP